MPSTDARIPSIYGELSPAAVAAYGAWNDALVERAEHMLECLDGCNLHVMICPAGMALAEAERAGWQQWREAYAGVPS